MSFAKLAILSALAGSTWGVNTEDLRRIYLATVLPQFTYCASVWYVPNGGYGFKQREGAAVQFMRSVQARAAKIIAVAFRTTSGAALNVELYLLPVQNQMDIALYDFLLRIVTSPTYSLIKCQRTLPNRILLPSQSQYQQSLYAQLSPLHKLEIRYSAVYNWDLSRLENPNTFSYSPLVECPKNNYSCSHRRGHCNSWPPCWRRALCYLHRWQRDRWQSRGVGGHCIHSPLYPGKRQLPLTGNRLF